MFRKNAHPVDFKTGNSCPKCIFIIKNNKLCSNFCVKRGRSWKFSANLSNVNTVGQRSEGRFWLVAQSFRKKATGAFFHPVLENSVFFCPKKGDSFRKVVAKTPIADGKRRLNCQVSCRRSACVKKPFLPRFRRSPSPPFEQIAQVSTEKRGLTSGFSARIMQSVFSPNATRPRHML